MKSTSDTGIDAGRKDRLKRLLNRFGPFIGLIFAWSLFAILRQDTFVTWSNTQIILETTTVVGVAALGATLIIISGGIDLSVGSMIALTTVVTALFLQLAGGGEGRSVSVPPALTLGAAAGAVA